MPNSTSRLFSIKGTNIEFQASFLINSMSLRLISKNFQWVSPNMIKDHLSMKCPNRCCPKRKTKTNYCSTTAENKKMPSITLTLDSAPSSPIPSKNTLRQWSNLYSALCLNPLMKKPNNKCWLTFINYSSTSEYSYHLQFTSKSEAKIY